mgnify:CR=1 FL=1
MAVAVVGAALAVGSTIWGGISGSNAAKKAKQAAMYAAKVKQMEVTEQLRRQGLTNRQAIGTARMMASNSGVLLKGTPDYYLHQMQREMDRELEWMQMSGQMAVKAIKKGANVQYNSDMTGVYANLVGGLASAANTWYTGRSNGGP